MISMDTIKIIQIQANIIFSGILAWDIRRRFKNANDNEVIF